MHWQQDKHTAQAYHVLALHHQEKRNYKYSFVPQDVKTKTNVAYSNNGGPYNPVIYLQLNKS